MKQIITLLIFTFSAVASADIVTSKLPVCTTMDYFDQANTMKERSDTRGLGYLMKQGHCFYLTPGMEYSVIDMNYQKDHRSWVKIRVYTSGAAAELYSWYGFVQ